MIKEKTVKRLPARVTYLEMAQRHLHNVPAPLCMSLALMRAKNCPIHFYRYLYQQIGRAHHWNLRRKQSDEEVLRIIQSEETILHILYVDGCPAGFAETGLSNTGQAEIVYFGIVADYQGRGLSRFFLSEVIATAWDNNISKLVIQTNSLDSPQGLQLYQKMGFTPVGTADVEIESWPDD